jgi:hypothetical protein
MVGEQGVAANGGGCGKGRGILREENNFPPPHPREKKNRFLPLVVDNDDALSAVAEEDSVL